LVLGSCFLVLLDAGFVELADFFELDAQSVPQGAFGAKFVEQGLSLLEGVGRNVFRFKEIAKAALNLRFGEQDFLLERSNRSPLIDKDQNDDSRLALPLFYCHYRAMQERLQPQFSAKTRGLKPSASVDSAARSTNRQGVYF
jgi:hypothetical protein